METNQSAGGAGMNPEQQRIAIAEACGWKFIPEYYHGEDQPPEFTTVTPDGKHLCGYYPDYLNDLNAMHEAEKQLLATQFKRYHDVLVAQVIGWSAHENEHIAIHATAAQRAEAFLRTINLWKP
jgi:hypothetical protein